MRIPGGPAAVIADSRSLACCAATRVTASAHRSGKAAACWSMREPEDLSSNTRRTDGKGKPRKAPRAALWGFFRSQARITKGVVVV